MGEDVSNIYISLRYRRPKNILKYVSIASCIYHVNMLLCSHQRGRYTHKAYAGDCAGRMSVLI